MEEEVARAAKIRTLELEIEQIAGDLEDTTLSAEERVLQEMKLDVCKMSFSLLRDHNDDETRRALKLRLKATRRQIEQQEKRMGLTGRLRRAMR